MFKRGVLNVDMKRIYESGDSSAPKHSLLEEDTTPTSFRPQSSSQTSSYDGSALPDFSCLGSQQSDTSSYSGYPQVPMSLTQECEFSDGFGCLENWTKPDSDSSFELHIPKKHTIRLEDFLQENIDNYSVDHTAKIILTNSNLKEALINELLNESHCQFKSALKTSSLKVKKDRSYLLTLNPNSICEEFLSTSVLSTRLLTQGILGLPDPSLVLSSRKHLNAVALIMSTAAKSVNRNCTGYALQLTTAVRAGGLREDTIKVLSSCLVHPRTSQKYDRSTLAKDWDSSMQSSLRHEEDHFRAQEAISKQIMNHEGESLDENVAITEQNDLGMTFKERNLKSKRLLPSLSYVLPSSASITTNPYRTWN